MEQIVIAVIVSIITGGVSAFGTVKALHVHISYLKDITNKLESAIARAHSRIDSIERR